MTIPMADAIHYMSDRPTLLVQVHTDAGLIGLGEAATYGGFPESMEALITGELRRTILGQALGPRVKLAIDANNAWTPSLALRFMRAVADQDIYWLEEPVATEDWTARRASPNNWILRSPATRRQPACPASAI